MSDILHNNAFDVYLSGLIDETLVACQPNGSHVVDLADAANIYISDIQLLEPAMKADEIEELQRAFLADRATVNQSVEVKRGVQWLLKRFTRKENAVQSEIFSEHAVETESVTSDPILPYPFHITRHTTGTVTVPNTNRKVVLDIEKRSYNGVVDIDSQLYDFVADHPIYVATARYLGKHGTFLEPETMVQYRYVPFTADKDGSALGQRTLISQIQSVQEPYQVFRSNEFSIAPSHNVPQAIATIAIGVQSHRANDVVELMTLPTDFYNYRNENS